MEQHTSETLNRYYSKKKKRKKRRKYAFYTLLTVFFVILITVLSLTVFFNISDIAVTGNSHYTSDEIIAASGMQVGQNLFRLNKFKVIKKLHEKMPYLSEITIDRHLPVGIEIIVNESVPFLCVTDGEDCLILDENLKVLEKVQTAPENMPVVTDLAVTNSAVGSVLTAENGADARLLALTVSLKENIGDDMVTAIDVTTSYKVTFEYMNRITVNVGTVENIDLKLKLVKHVIDENKSQENAKIDVSSGYRATYRSVDKTPVRQTTDDASKDTEKNE